MKPLGIHHVAVAVTDLDDAVDFYTRVLGMGLRHDRPESIGVGAWLDVGAQQLHLIETTRPPAPGQHFAVLVSDLDATLSRLRALGTTVTDPVPIGTARQAFLTDPSGNTIELHEPAT